MMSNVNSIGGCKRDYGNANAGVEFTGSAVPGSFIDTNFVTGLIHGSFNSYVPGRYLFQFHNGIPIQTS